MVLLGARQRCGNKRKQKNLVIIVSQGKKTEPIYFSHFNKATSGFVLRIKSQATDPISLIKYGKYLKEEEYDIGPKDKVFCVYDVDNTPEVALNEAKKKANEYGVSSCISNPCFELWYLLHFTYSTSCLDSYDDVKNELLQFMSDYEKNKDVHDRLLSKQLHAITNAKNLEEHHKREGIKPIRMRNPSTQVYEVVEYINKLS